MHIVLVNPKIPHNTGAIARTCAATDTTLHLVGQLGFDISEKAVRRAGLDYWPYVKLNYYENWECFFSDKQDADFWFFSKRGSDVFYDREYLRESYLVFGSETDGFPEEVLSYVTDGRLVYIPMANERVRSLNLSNAVSIGLYEALRVTGMAKIWPSRE